MARTRVPPAIFQTTQFSSNPLTSSSSQIDLAYKHPILLIDPTDDDYDDNIIDCDDDGISEKNREMEIKLIDVNSTKITKNYEGGNCGDETSSFIIPQPNRNAFSSLNFEVPKIDDSNGNTCRLIGKVNPNLIKTWEQLSGSVLKTSQSDNKDKDKSIPMSENSEQQSCVLFYRKPFTFKEDNFFEVNNDTDNNTFKVNKILHSESSGDFYDSIDDQSLIENTYVVEDLMNSIYQDSEYVGGEGMAERCESITKTNKICWSIEETNTRYET